MGPKPLFWNIHQQKGVCREREIALLVCSHLLIQLFRVRIQASFFFFFFIGGKQDPLYGEQAPKNGV